MKFPADIKPEAVVAEEGFRYAMHLLSAEEARSGDPARWRREGAKRVLAAERPGVLVATNGRCVTVAAVDLDPDDVPGPVTPSSVIEARGRVLDATCDPEGRTVDWFCPLCQEHDEVEVEPPAKGASKDGRAIVDLRADEVTAHRHDGSRVVRPRKPFGSKGDVTRAAGTEGEFPNWRSVVGRHEGVRYVRFAINPEYLVAMYAAIRGGDGEAVAALELEVPLKPGNGLEVDSTVPVRVTGSGGMGSLMQVTIDRGFELTIGEELERRGQLSASAEEPA